MFSGPSKHVIDGMARGVASFAMQINMLDQLPAPDRAQLAELMSSQGAPTTMAALIKAAADVVREQKMGWIKKNQYLGAIQGHLEVLGMPRSEAAYLKGMIEIRAA